MDGNGCSGNVLQFAIMAIRSDCKTWEKQMKRYKTWAVRVPLFFCHGRRRSQHSKTQEPSMDNSSYLSWTINCIYLYRETISIESSRFHGENFCEAKQFAKAAVLFRLDRSLKRNHGGHGEFCSIHIPMSAQTHSPTAAGFAKLGIKYEIFLKRTKRAKLNASL